MTPYQRYQKNRDLLQSLEPGDKIRILDLNEPTPRLAKVCEFVRREGNVLVALDRDGRPRRFALMWVSCSKHPAPQEKRKPDKAAV